MILVLLGTQHNDFHRLLDEIEKNIQNKVINDEVIVQAGFTKYKSHNMKLFNLISKEDLEKLVNKADLVISHAGLGSLEMALKKGKKVIAVARKKEYGEHVNNHQNDIVEEFNKMGFIIGIDSVGKLENAIKKAISFVPNKYENVDDTNFLNTIINFIEK